MHFSHALADTRPITLLVFLMLMAAYPSVQADSEPKLGKRLKFYRWLENYEDVTDDKLQGHPLAHLKKIRLSGNKYPYLTLGGDYRLRYEHHANQNFGVRADFSTDSILHRVLLHGDLQSENMRLFVQFSYYQEDGQRGGPGPLDESNPDLQLAFFDWTPSWGQVRIGRQEIVLGNGRKTGVREGPNQRRSFDGVRLTLPLNGTGSLDFLYSREVQVRDGAFEDRSSNGPDLRGIYANKIATWFNHSNLDIFYLGSQRDNARYDQGKGNEKRHSFGARLWKKKGKFQYDYEATYQRGTFAEGDISAWGLSTETSYRLSTDGWQPRLGLRANYSSGDDDKNDKDLGTYNSLFPNIAYITPASIFAPGNITDLQPFIRLKPHRNLALFMGLSFLWRTNTNDAIYVVPGIPITNNNASDARYVATLVNIDATWKLSPYITLKAAYVHNEAGSYLDDIGGDDSEFVRFSISTRF